MGSSSAQATLPIDITTPLGEGKLLVKTIQGDERISGLFRYTLELVSSDDSLDFSAIVGKGVTVTMPLADGSKEYLHGIAGRFVQAGKDVRVSTYYLDLHPWLWLLSFEADCRIFQNKSTPEIIKQVFSDLGQTDFKDSLTGSYKPREYCVQYMETAFRFVSRLMEEEGIFYFFEHANGKHTLVLADDSSTYPACKGATTLPMRPTLATWAHENTVLECTIEQQVVTGTYKADDYNFETPSTDLL